MMSVDKTVSRPKIMAQRFCLAAMAVLLPILVFVIAEWGLRLAGYGYNPHFFVRQKVGGVESYVRNPAFSWRFFPKPMARLSTAMVIPVEKPKDVLRVVVLGSSAALGDPEPSFGFSRMLEVMLQARYPGKKIEVYNTAATAINSNVILPIAEDCRVLQPDLFVVYEGNNEVVGPFGLSAALTPFFSNRAVIKTQVWISSTRLGQWVKSIARQPAASGDEWRGMELFLEHKVRLGDPNLEKVYSHFEGNLSDICRLARRAGVKVVLSSVIVNDLDCAPFVSLHRATLGAAELEHWNALFEKGKTEEASSHWKSASEAYGKAAAIDSEYAELHYRAGRCQWSDGQPEAARKSLEMARERDALRFRADARMNGAIQKVASHNGAIFVDAEALAQKASPGGVPGENLLYEHVHLNFAGNYLLASAVMQSCEQALGLKSDLPTPSVDECQKRLAWTVFDEKRITERLRSRLQVAPFTSQCDNAQVLERLNARLSSLDLELKGKAEASDAFYREALSARPADWQLRMNYLQFLYEQGRHPQAHEQAQQIFQRLPMEHFSLMNMGVTFQKLKRYDEAEDYLKRTIQANPYLSEGYEKLGLLREDQKRFDEAETLLQKRRSPTVMANFYTRAGVYYARQHANDLARQYYDRALKAVPGFPEAVADLKRLDRPVEIAPEETEPYKQAMEWMKQGQFALAVDAWRKVVEAAPESARVRNNLGFALVKTGRYNEAIEQFSEAARLNPKSVDGLQNLASVYGLMERHAEAISTLQKAIAIKPSRAFYLFLADEYEKSGQADEAEHNRVLARQFEK